MSMKRSKEVSRGRNARDLDAGFWEKKGPEKVYAFDTDVATKPDDAFVPYAPTRRYELEALVAHAKFGKGIVTDVEPQKVLVLFQEGTRKLSHGLAAPPPPRQAIEDPGDAMPAASSGPNQSPPVSEEPVTEPNPTRTN